MIAREHSLLWLAYLTFFVGGVLGGGGTSASFSMLTELLACLLGAISLAGTIDGRFPRQAVPALALLGVVCLIPLLQVIALPATIWDTWPGHAIPAQILRVAGLGSLPQPLSLTPEQTCLMGMSLIVPVSMFIATLQLCVRNRDSLMILIVLFALVSAVLGMSQVAAGGGLNLGIYRQIHDGNAIGFFANRNHEADLLLVAIPLSTHLIQLQRWPQHVKAYMMAGAVAFFSISVISTISRTGVSLLPVALFGAWVVWVGDIRSRKTWLGLAAFLVILAAGLVLIALTPVGSHVYARFNDVGSDLRFSIWTGSWAATKAFWPLGSGMGSFAPVFNMFEDLDTVNAYWVNHAHNDYLEILLETGVAGAVLLAIYPIIVLLALRRPAPMPFRRQRYAAVVTLMILLLHSMTDYPLRTFALISIFAFANGLLYPARDMHRIRRSGSFPVVPAPDFAPEHRHAV